jgi:hypothetical protein
MTNKTLEAIAKAISLNDEQKLKLAAGLSGSVHLRCNEVSKKLQISLNGIDWVDIEMSKGAP